MPSQIINFADVESFEPVPEGEYSVEIEKVEVRMNKAGDGQYLNWEMTIVNGDYENRRLWMITSLKPTALFRLKQVFEDLGVLDSEDQELEWDDDVEPSQQGGPLLIYPEVEGMQCVAVVKNEMYEGKERNRVEQVFDEDERPKKKATKKKRKSSDNDEVASSRRSSTRKRSRREEPEDEDYDEDEEDEDEDDDEEEEAPRRPSRRSSGRDNDDSGSTPRARNRNRGRRKMR